MRKCDSKYFIALYYILHNNALVIYVYLFIKILDYRRNFKMPGYLK